MPRVKFLQDFQGRETAEVFYRLGQEVDLPDHVAARLIADRRAELVQAEPVVEEPAAIATSHFYGPVYVGATEPHFADEPQAKEPEPVEDVITTETIKPKRGKRGKK